MKVNIAKIMKSFDMASFMKCQRHSSLKNEGRKEGPQVEFAWRRGEVTKQQEGAEHQRNNCCFHTGLRQTMVRLKSFQGHI